ncbi:MAG TPA: hypothetical protein VE093_27500 [Polyangiaceae bacterium]|nr:hypothetical protein [Polyangiaceae bacterium]
MQLPGVNASSQVYIECGDHVEGAAEAWSEAEILTEAQKLTVKEVSAMVGPAVASLRAASGAAEEAARMANRLRARFGVRDVVLDRRVMGLSDTLLNGPAGRDRQSPAYKQVFLNDKPHEITGGNMREEPEVVEVLLSRYDATPDFDGKAAARSLIAGALAKSVEARGVLDAAEMAENKAADAEVQARLTLRSVLEQAYGKLRASFPGRRDFVESFFLRRERSAAKKDAADEPAPAPHASV